MSVQVLEKNSTTETGQEANAVRVRVIRKMWQYIDENFHKFSDNNKVKVSLALAQKDMPTQLDGKVSETIINIIKAQTEEKPKESVVENGRRLSINT